MNAKHIVRSHFHFVIHLPRVILGKVLRNNNFKDIFLKLESICFATRYDTGFKKTMILEVLKNYKFYNILNNRLDLYNLSQS